MYYNVNYVYKVHLRFLKQLTSYLHLELLFLPANELFLFPQLYLLR